MFDMFENDDGLNKDQAFEMLNELEKNTPEEIRRQRAHFRLTIKAKVTLQPGNASDRLKMKMQGVTGDISQGGCRVLFPMPVMVGDVFRLDFDREQLGLPTTYVRCMRCIQLREDAFEAGFMFFSPIELPERLMQHADFS